MRRQLLIVLALSLFIASDSVKSQVLMDENFNYPAGDSLTAHGWTWINSYINTILVATGSLTYAGYGNSGIGNMVRLHNSGQDVYRQTDSTSSASVYVSFLINVDSAGTGDYFFALLPNNSTTNYTMRTFIKTAAGGFQMGLSKSTEAATYTSGTYSFGITYLVIVKYTFLTGSTTDDQLRLFVLSGAIPGTEPAPSVGPITGAANDAPNISRIALRQGSAAGAATLNVDGFRVFRSWSNIVGIRPINTIAEQFSLSQNYPNPFNPNTNIRFSIPERGFVTIKVYDMLGKEVSNLVEGNYPTGTYEVNFEGKGLSSGTYIYRMNFNASSGKEFTDTKKLMLVK